MVSETGMRVERVTSANETAVLAYLERAPYENVYLSDLIRNDRSASARNGLFAAVDSGRIEGAASFGRQIVLAAAPRAVPALAELAHRRRGERMIVGPRAAVIAFWNLVRDGRPAPRLVRERQFVMAVDVGRLKRADGTIRVRMARAQDAGETVNASAQMIEHELEYDPRRTSPEFASGVRAMIERERWWVGEIDGGRLCFFCSIGPSSKKTAQLQGIWVPPELRGRGYATAALSAICARLLESRPSLSLYVNDFNEPAIALYRRVGFEHVADFQTLLF